ncbi:hypothetical protein OH146_12490 [Salinibacterium sp. SYSU T00001]|uniref:hypothetical protein n=1 Tax=Homoserinimonas sedimenticola TaxID=2986805 RepID=UPI0022362EEA|nr:hypothetical protein [Salinibacterium sedimenticola]MCW4386592.1 hypothetical protein [Salinibacterium sedimenticola]
MRLLRLWSEARRDDTGSASLEFLTAGTLLLVPMVYLIVALSALQSGSLAVESAARHAARTYVEAPTTDAAALRAERAVAFALADHGLDPSAGSIRISCSPNPADCLTRLGIVTVTVETQIAMPLVPAALAVDTPLSIPVRATASQQVSRFAELP